MQPRPAAAITAVVAFLATGCGTSSTAARTHASSTPAAPAATITAAPADGPLVSGTGYRLHVPKGWTDVTKKLAAGDADRALAAGSATHGHTSNLNVVLSPKGISTGQLGTVVGKIRDQMRATAPGYAVLPDVEVAGTTAGHLGGVRTQGRTSYWLEQFVLGHGAHTYIVSFSFSTASTKAERTRTIEPVLASWKWS